MEQMLAYLFNLLNLAVTNKTATAVAAVALAVVVYGLKYVPVVKDFVAKDSKLETVATLVLAVAPAVVTTLSTSTSWYEAAMTALMTFLAAVGVKTAKDKLMA